MGGTNLDLQLYRSAPLPDAGVKVPSDMIAFADAMQRRSGHIISVANADLAIDGVVMNPSDPVLQQLEKPASERHYGTANVSFCDGHVESIKLPILFGRSDEALDRWNNENLPHRERLFDQ